MGTTMTGQEQTRDLIEKARTGGREAFDELTRPLCPLLLERIRLRMGPSLREKLEAEDVLQEALARAFRSVPDFRWQGEGSFERWVEGIAVHVILHSARTHRRRRELELTREPAADDVSPSRAERRRERLERLKGAIEALSPDHREVIRLSRLQGLTVKEVAARMGRSESAVKNLLLRAVKELRNSFGDTESLGLPAESPAGDGSEEKGGGSDGR
jgi:RNA polymerase sigma-70 factor (ECF subfamily)